MAKYSVFYPGYDPTSDVAAISRSNLVKMVNEAGFVAPLGGIIQAERTALPNVVTYPELQYFLVHVLDSGVASGEIYFYNGTTWVQIKFGLGSIDGSYLIDASVVLGKLSAVGYSAKQILRINTAGDGIEAVNFSTILEANIIPHSAIAKAAGQYRLLISNASFDFESQHFTTGLGNAFHTLTPLTAFNNVSTDKLIISRGTDGLLQTMHGRRFLEQMIDELPAVDEVATGDRVLLYDESADPGSKAKQVDVQNLLPEVISAQTVANPTSISVNARGQVTSIGGGGTVFTKKTMQAALPLGPGDANKVAFDTDFGAEPSFIEFRLICTDAAGDAPTGYTQNETVSLHAVMFAGGDPDFGYYYRVVGEIVYLCGPDVANANARIAKKDGSGIATFDTTKWQAILKAIA